MPDTSGVYSLPPSYKATSGQTIRTEQHNPPLEDIAQALTDSLPRDGSAPMTGDLAMNNRKITGLRKATSSNDAVRFGQVFEAAGKDKLVMGNTAGDGFSYKDPADFATAEQGQRAEVAAPAGSVMHFAMQTPPSGWLKCNGAAVSRTTHAALFAAIGTRFGAGDGSTTFNLPDMRGEFIRGWDDGRGVDGGRALGSAQGDMLKSHSHGYQRGFSSGMDGGGYQVWRVDNNKVNTDASGGHETRPRNVALLVCIKT